MIIIKSVLVSLLAVVGIICSYTDIKKSIIPNKVIFVFLPFSVICIVIYFCFAGTSDILKYIVVVVLTIIIGFFMYFLHIWAGGDVKLFILLSLLIPPDLIKQSSPIAAVFVFTFIFAIAFVFLVFQSLYLTIKKEKRVVKFNREISLKHSICPVVTVMAMQTVFRLMFKSYYFNYISLFLFLNILVVLGISKIKWIINNFVIIVFSIISVVGIIANIHDGYYTFDLRNVVIVFVVILFRALAEKYNYKEINTSDVKQGMILSYSTVLQFANSRVKGLPLFTTEDISSRITFDEAESIKRWERSKNGKSTIIILRKVPFAIFIFLGYLFYILMGIFIW